MFLIFFSLLTLNVNKNKKILQSENLYPQQIIVVHWQRSSTHWIPKIAFRLSMMDIEIKITKNEIVRTTIIEPVKEPSMTALLSSLKSVKQQSNDTMTNFVNSEKTTGLLSCPKRKDHGDDSESEWRFYEDCLYGY